MACQRKWWCGPIVIILRRRRGGRGPVQRGVGQSCLRRTTGRTSGEEMPLKSPWRRSLRAMVTSA